MKKALVVLLAIIIMGTTIACNNSEKENNTADTETTEVIYYYRSGPSYVYKATFISDVLLKIECWCDSAYEGDSSNFYDHDVLVINIDNASTDFLWLDDKETAFTVTLVDKDSYALREPKLVTFVKQP